MLKYVPPNLLQPCQLRINCSTPHRQALNPTATQRRKGTYGVVEWFAEGKVRARLSLLGHQMSPSLTLGLSQETSMSRSKSVMA